MRSRICMISAAVLVSTFSISSSSGNLFQGIWCVGHEGLVIKFIGKDSLHVTSLSDESVNGLGTYTKKDQKLFATLNNDDVELKMGYEFKVREDSSIRARILFFTANGDSVNHPRRWLRMVRCNPEKGDVPPPDDDEESEKAAPVNKGKKP